MKRTVFIASLCICCLSAARAEVRLNPLFAATPYCNGTAWQLFSTGTTIGYKKLDCHATLSAAKVRLTIDEARAYPLISNFGIYLTPVSVPGDEPKKTGTREEKAI